MESLVRSEETPARDRKSVSLILECVNSISSLGGGDVLINCADLGLGFEEVERVLSLIDSEINSPRGE
jgi:hypothetical protein